MPEAFASRGRVMVGATRRAWVAAGVARIPEDRHGVGLVGPLPLWENAIAERYRTRFAHGPLVRRQRAHRYARDIVVALRRARGARHRHAGAIAVRRQHAEADPRPRARDRSRRRPPPVLIVADQPTWGLDIGAVAFVHQQLIDACARGAAVLLISDDLDEIYALADRIAVIHAGRLTDARPRAAWDLATIGLAMAGAGPGGAHHMRLEARGDVSRVWLVAAPFAAVAFTLVAAALFVAWAGAPVGRTYSLIFEGGFGSRFAWSETLTRATPLILTGLSAAIAFRAHFYNIGAEGQLYAGALAAVAVGGMSGAARAAVSRR